MLLLAESCMQYTNNGMNCTFFAERRYIIRAWTSSFLPSLLFFTVFLLIGMNRRSPDKEDDNDHHHKKKHSSTASSADGASNTSIATLSTMPNSNVPASTIGILTVVLVVTLIITAACCILYCARVRRKLNDHRPTRSINDWTAFFTSKPNDNSPSHVEKGNNSQNHHYWATKPAPLPPCDEEVNLPDDDRWKRPAIVLAPGWLFASHNPAVSQEEILPGTSDSSKPIPAHTENNV